MVRRAPRQVSGSLTRPDLSCGLRSLLKRIWLSRSARGSPTSPPRPVALFRNPSAKLIQLNAAGFDAAKHGALPLVAEARAGIEALGRALATWANHMFPAEQFHAESWPNNAITLSRIEWLWSAKRA
jgi:hypothetical protein